MKTLKNLSFALLAAGSLAACSASRTGSGTGTSGTSGGSTVDSASSQTTGNTSNVVSDNQTLGSIGTSVSSSNGGITGNAVSEQNLATTNPGSMRNDVNSGSGITPSYSGSGSFGNSVNVSTYSASISAETFLPQAVQSGMKEVEISRIAQQKASNPKVKEFAAMMVKQHTKKNQQLLSIASSKGISLNNTTAVGAGSSTIGSFSGSSNNSSTSAGISSINDNKTALSGNAKVGFTSPGLPNNSWKSNSATNMSLKNSGGSMINSDMNSVSSTVVNELNNLSGAAFDKKYLEIMIQDHEQAVALFTKAMESSDHQVKTHAAKSLPALRAHLYDAKRINSQLSW